MSHCAWKGHRAIRVDLETWEVLEAYRRHLGGQDKGRKVSMAKAVRQLLLAVAKQQFRST